MKFILLNHTKKVWDFSTSSKWQ